MNNKFIILAVVIVLIVGVSGMYWYLQMSLQRNVDTITATTTKTQIASSSAPIPEQSTATTTSVDHPGMKLYRNDQWGFEFWYPEKWQLFIEPHGLGYYSKLVIVAAPSVAESDYNDSPFLINIVDLRLTEELIRIPQWPLVP